MKPQKFQQIKNQLERIIASLSKKYASRLNGLSFSVLSLDDFASIYGQKELWHKYFTGDELLYCRNRILSLAGRFAAKLAIRNAFKKNIPWNNMNISSAQNGEPIVLFPKSASVSISHEENLVIALAAWATDLPLALGVDVVSTARIAKLAKQTKIMQKIFTPCELKEIKSPLNIAEKWAGKEAVSKALGAGIWHGALLHNMEIIKLGGNPFIKLSGKVSQLARNKAIYDWEIFFMRDGDFVLAFVIGARLQ